MKFETGRERYRLLTIADLCQLLRFNRRTYHRKRHQNEVPEPIQGMKSPRWEPEFIEAWITAGCPRNFKRSQVEE